MNPVKHGGIFMDKVEYYSFKNVKADITPLIFAINMIGDDLIGLELGIGKADSLITILHNCNIKKIYGIDNWKPYYDYLKANPDGNPNYYVDEKKQDIIKFLAYHHIKYSGMEDKVSIIEGDSMYVVNKIEDESLDFLFFDAMMTKEQTFIEALHYYKKIKKGGYFMGHDAHCTEQVIEPIKEVMRINKNTNKLMIYHNCFMFKI
jgi:hypothetical protein